MVSVVRGFFIYLFIYKESLHLYFILRFVLFFNMGYVGVDGYAIVSEEARRGQRLSGPLQQKWQKVADIPNHWAISQVAIQKIWK